MSRSLQITLSLKEILFDIRNKAYLTGKTREADDRIKATIQASTDDDAQMLRAIQNATNRVCILLSDYIDDESIASVDNSFFDDESTANSISLTLPANFNGGMAKSVATMIHDYIVSSALREWFQLCFKADVNDYVQLNNVELDDIKAAVSKRKAPTRPTD